MISDNGAFSCFMKNKNKSEVFIVFAGLVVLISLFLLAFNISAVFAQENDTVATTTVSEEEVIEAGEEELPADVLLDEKVTTEDLEAVEANVLPGSPLHFFKRVGWAFQEILETDPIEDAELKIQHANQELAELKQLIDEKGFTEVSPSTINAVMNRFEGRLENVNNVADALKELKESDPEAVDKLLNNLTDKQFKYQKVLDSIEKDVIKEIEENEDAGKRVEDVFIKVTETKDKVLEHFGKVIGTVDEDNPEKIAERIIKITDKQDGSEFKHLKNLEVLKRLEEQVPESAKGAIALAQENTLKFFNRDVSALPENMRAERFERYSRFSYGDETRQLSFLDDLKLLDDIPPEILKKIEEVKEFAIAKFEEKMSNFQQPDVLESYMGHLSGENFNDMVLAEQFASRAVFEDRPEIKQRMDDIRDRSVEEFTARFTDPDSQKQIAKFQELERILEERPGDPKVMRMMQELEAQVRSDPTKAEFLNQMDQLENKMRGEFEEKFRQEGDRYFDRIGTLDPRDFEIYQEFRGEDFLPDDLAEMFLDHGVDQYRDYMRDVDDPNQFDRFNTRFNDVPQFVIDEISHRDDGFGDAMQFKRQAMEKLRFEQERQMEINRQQVDYEERELFHQLDRTRQQADEDFWRRIDSIPYENFDERQALFEEKRQTDLARLEQESTARLELFNRRLELDPWCDSSCQQIQKQFIDQEFRHQRERIQDDYTSQQKQIEFDLGREMQNNPLFGVCSTPESCDAYCADNPNIPACQGFHEPVFNDDFGGPKDYDCGPGNYFDFNFNGCVEDPYYRAPTDFTQCPFGSHWEQNRGFCEPDFIPEPIFYPEPGNIPDCGPDSYFEFRENRCIPYHIGPACPPGFFLGPFGECKQENFQCPDYSASFFGPCPDGEFREDYIDNNGCKVIGECIPFGQPTTCPDLSVMEPFPCPTGSYRGPDFIDHNGCKAFGECVSDGGRPTACPMYDIFPCPDGTYRGAGYTNPDGCYMPGECVISSQPSLCPDLSTMFPEPCPEGQYRETVADQNGCKVFGQCVGDSIPPVTCDAYFEGYSYNSYTNTCELMSTSGCSNPYKYHSLIECQNGNITSPTTSTTTSQNYWCGDNACDPGEDTFSCPVDCGGSTTSTYPGDENSCPGFAYSMWDQSGVRYCQLNDSASCDYNHPSYLTNDGSYSGSNCPVYDNQTVYPTTTPTYPTSGDECTSLQDILPGCHLMPESPDVRFNTAMDQYVQVGTRTIQYCSTSLIPGCTAYYTTSTTPTGGYCGDNVCDSNETSSSCASDCGGGTYGGNSCTGYTDSSSCQNNSCVWYSTYCDDAAHGGTGSGSSSCNYNGTCDSGEDTYSCSADCSSGSNATYCPPPSYWDSSINGCAPGTSTTCMTPADFGTCSDGYDYDSSGCVVSCAYVAPTITPPPPPAPTCMTAADFGTCYDGYEYDGGGCVIGCLSPPPPPPPPPPAEETPPPSEPPPPTDEPPPAASVWEAFKALFGF